MKLAAIALAVAAAVGAFLLAQDIRACPGALRQGHAPSTTIPFAAAERILNLRDQLELRRVLGAAHGVAKIRVRLDNALDVQGSRAVVENQLAALAGSTNTRVAAEAEDVYGVLSFGDLAHGNFAGRPQIEASLSAFQNAVRLDPSDAAARWNLEVVLRLLIARGVRTGPGQGAGRGTGHQGATGGFPGRGF